MISRYLSKKYVSTGTALDFGCGAGRSTRLLKSYGFNVLGADISQAMIEKAILSDNTINYMLLTERPINTQIVEQQFDLIMLSFVIMEISTEEKMIRLFRDLSTLLSSNGKVVIVMASDKLYQTNWYSMTTSFYPENVKAKSGDIVKVYLTDYDLELSDYLWFEEDCELFFSKSGFTVVDKHKPLGRHEDSIPWETELKYAPFVLYMLESGW